MVIAPMVHPGVPGLVEHLHFGPLAHRPFGFAVTHAVDVHEDDFRAT